MLLKFHILMIFIYLSCEEVHSYIHQKYQNISSIIVKPRQTTICEERNIPGLICESCDRLAFCVKINGNWQTYPVEPCDIENGEFCNVQERKCSMEPGPCNRIGYEGNFPCTSDGIFPDPYDCQIYHLCYQAEPDVLDYLPIAGTAKCEGIRAFSVISSSCSLDLFDDACKKQQYNCTYPGETHSWPNNPNIFYICQPAMNNLGKYFLYPTLYRCGPDEVYDDVTCILDSNIEKRTTKKMTTLKTSTSKQIGTTDCESAEILCSGKVGLKPDPCNCLSYYHCPTKNGLAIHRTCPKNTYFNQFTLSCSFGTC